MKQKNNPEIIKGMKFAIDLIKDSPTVFDKEKAIKKGEADEGQGSKGRD